MNNLEHMVKSAFDGVQMPEGLEGATIAYVMERAAEADRKDGDARKGDSKATEMPRASRHVKASDSSAIKMPSARHPNILVLRTFRVAAACALAFVLCAGGIGAYAAYATETASATVQAGADVRLGVNRFGRVLSVEVSDATLDEETAAKLESLRGMDFEDALDELLQVEALAPSVEEGDVEVQIACRNSSQEATMRQQSQECIGRHVQARDGSGDGYGNGHGTGSGSENAKESDAGNSSNGAGGGDSGNGGSGNGRGHGRGEAHRT